MLAKNESQMDRAVRLIVGLVLLVAGSQLSGWLQIVLYILAIIALLTAATGTCALYKLFGINTNKAKAEGEPKAEEPKTMNAVKPETDSAEAELEVEEPAEEETMSEEPAEEETKTEEPAAEEESKEETK